MKSKIVLSAIVLLSLVLWSCGNDDDNLNYSEGKWTAQSTLKLLSTTWVYDNPAESVWEKTEFRESGVLYSSYFDNSIYEIQEEVNGKFFLDAKGNITGQFELASGAMLNLDWTILSISDLELAVKNNTAGLKFTYGKLLDAINLSSGESVTPDYEALVPDTITVYKHIEKGEMAMPQIKGYASHDTKIAEVDASTGEIKALSGGCTYIDVITTEGTAMVEVNVKGILPYDYCEFIGIDREEVYEKFGRSPYSDTNERMMYLLSEGDFGYLVFDFDTWRGRVKAVSVVAKEKPTFTNEEMRAYLNATYHVYEKGTTATQYAYINAETYEKATAGIIWYTENRQLVVVAIDHDLFVDYSPLLGKTKDEVLSLMGKTPFANAEGYIAYGLNDKYLDMASFYYTYDFVEFYPTAQIIILAVKKTANRDDIFAFFNKKYVYLEKESTDEYKIWLTADGKLAIEYNLEYDQIWYYKNGAAASAKAMRARKLF